MATAQSPSATLGEGVVVLMGIRGDNCMQNCRGYSFFSLQKLLLLLVLASVFTSKAHAYSSGIVGQTTAGCTCHSPGQSANTSLSFASASGSFTVAPGGTLTITLAVAHSSQAAAGANIGVVNSSSQNAGTLSPASGSGLSLSSSELRHSSPKAMSGGEATFTFTWTAPTTPGTYTIRAAGNAVNDNGGTSGDYYNTGTQTITVESLPSVTVTTPNGGEEWCRGGTQNITWTATSVTNVKIELSSDGGNSYPTTLVASTPAAAGSWTWNIPGAQPLGDQYKVRISDASNASVNDGSNNNFSIKGLTAISQQPTPQTVCEGNAVSLSVVASGANLSYLWRKGGTPVPGANSATYTIANPTPTDAGSYDVVVTGSCGASVTSNAANLTVRGKPHVTTQLNNILACRGESVTLSIVATGEELAYQWRREGVPIAGATASSYTIASIMPADTGRYDVVVSGACTPNAVSNLGSIRLRTAPVISKQPESQIGCEGATVTLAVEATGVDQYEWRKNGTVLPGINTATFTIPNVSKNAEGQYTVTAVGICESTTSQTVTLTVHAKPAIAQQPSGVEVVEGSAIELGVVATGSSLSYQWKKNGVNIANAMSNQLSIAQATLADAGSYTVLVSNSCGVVTSATAEVTVIPAGPGPVLVLSQSTLDFGAVTVGKSKELKVTVKNSGTKELQITTIGINGSSGEPGAFSFVNPPSLPLLLEIQGTVELTIAFAPTTTGATTNKLVFTSNAPHNPEATLMGNGGVVALSSVLGTTVDWGEVEVAANKTMDVKIKNTGIVPARLTSAAIVGAGNGFTVLSTTPALPAELHPNEELTVQVQFAPSSEGEKMAELAVQADDMEMPLAIQLVGKGKTSSSVREETLASSVTVAPNPIVSHAVVSFVVEKRGEGTLSVVDAFGRTVKQLGSIATGQHTIRWDGTDNSGHQCANGVYRIVLHMDTAVQTVPVVLQR